MLYNAANIAKKLIWSNAFYKKMNLRGRKSMMPGDLWDF